MPSGPDHHGSVAGCRNGLLAKRSDVDISGFGAAVVLLPGDEVAVTDCEAPPQTSLDVVGPELFHFVLDAPRHDMGAPPQRAGRPDRPIDEVLLDVGEAVDGATLHQRVAVGQSGVAKYGDAVAQR